MAGADEGSPARSRSGGGARTGAVAGHNSIDNATVGQAVQAGVHNGDNHFHIYYGGSPPVANAPVADPPVAGEPVDEMRPEVQERTAQPGWDHRSTWYLARIVKERSPLLLAGCFVFSANSMVAGFLGFLFGVPPPGASPTADLGLVATMFFLAAPSGCLLLLRRQARRKESSRWPSLQEVHPVLARRFAQLNRPLPLVLAMSFLGLLMIAGASSPASGQSQSSQFSEFSLQAMTFLMCANGFVSCGVLLVRRRRRGASKPHAVSE
ncbi:hypothetical protein ABT324_06965 [Saccharopolyspora sp. NPDC000359]|uniref:hypothetical protein n=1 Tax=Saccharopolyspora sp. NPDC000359 TaxID=3154251 RepID=UPI0033217F2E